MSRPRILVLPGTPGWSYDFTARALERELAERFEFRVAFEIDNAEILAWRPDLILDMWWHGFAPPEFERITLRQVSSHRWRASRSGRILPRWLIRKYLRRCAGVVVPSRRLLDLLSRAAVEEDADVPIMLGPKGFDPTVMLDQRRRGGPLAIGWAGDASANDKGVSIALDAFPELRIADKCLTQSEMPDFYNGIDVIAIASEAEGDPRPLIEAMACGCFVVATDVGIVPELVRPGLDGLIVERTPEAFHDAVTWCRANLAELRARGAANAQRMLTERTWSAAAAAWAGCIERALERSTACATA